MSESHATIKIQLKKIDKLADRFENYNGEAKYDEYLDAVTDSLKILAGMLSGWFFHDSDGDIVQPKSITSDKYYNLIFKLDYETVKIHLSDLNLDGENKCVIS